VVIAIALAVVVAAYWALLFFAQRSMLYPRPPLSMAPARPADAGQVWLQTSFGKVEAWYLAPAVASNVRAPLLIFTHGNGELIDFWPGEFDPAREWGMGVLLVEYPGYGRSEGSPSERSITEAVLAAHDWARAQPGIDPNRIIPYGRSLGGGAAMALASQRPAPALILESTFSSVAAFARGFFAPGFLIRDRFDTLTAVKDFKGPILVLHGSQDTIVPPQHGADIAAAAPRAKLIWLPCGHNDCPRPWNEIKAFLAEHRLLR
jgi:fermentation-respiration switch protein FrsA (DUF1100 family)